MEDECHNKVNVFNIRRINKSKKRRKLVIFTISKQPVLALRHIYTTTMDSSCIHVHISENIYHFPATLIFVCYINKQLISLVSLLSAQMIGIT